jgi:hypothetical protein
MGLTRLRAEQISDIDYKQAVRVVTVTNVTLSGGAPTPVDGVSLSVGDRVLVTGQSTGSQNGIYQVQTVGTGSNGTWIRSTDTNATGELTGWHHSHGNRRYCVRRHTVETHNRQSHCHRYHRI